MDMIVSAKPDQLYNNSCGEHGGRQPRGFVPGSHAAAAEFFALFYAHCMPPTAQPRVLIEVGAQPVLAQPVLAHARNLLAY
jgi:hypothetical protein